MSLVCIEFLRRPGPGELVLEQCHGRDSEGNCSSDCALLSFCFLFGFYWIKRLILPFLYGQLIFLGHSSGIIGPHIFTRDQPLTRGFLILAGVIAVAILIATSISMAHRILNRKRKELLASLGQDAFDVTPLQTDKDQRFVYQL